MTNPAALPPQTAKRRQRVAVIILLVVTAAILGGIWYATRNQPLNAKVGDCLHQTGPDKLEIVGCGTADADFTVLGRVSGKEQIESTISVTSVCDQWPDTTNTFWQGEQGKKGDVLCLKATK